ncbi:MAG: ABC transporter substrate-binding protein [Elusimicrobiales bacterium]|jgi:iron complex transport system substrate-binding protein|nr:ABC transporter substrate-binding protein [Elusimicrobiales bacterium]NLH40125.1 ABC transporter substrate-binding protein [Elusimicrobiota bacterium]
MIKNILILFMFFVFFTPLLYCARIISLLPSYTEIIFSLGSGGELVGVTNYCNYPDEAKKIERVGDYLAPNVEKIYLLKPDIIFIGGWKNSFIKDINKLHTNTVVIPDETSIDDIYRSIRVIGKYLGKENEANELIGKMKKELAEIKEKSYKKVYVEVDDGGWTSGENSFISDVISKAGGINVFNDIKTSYFKADWEEVIKRNPDVVILLNTSKKSFLKRPMAYKISAVKNKSVYMLKSEERDMLSRPSPRIVGLIKKLNDIFNKK